MPLIAIDSQRFPSTEAQLQPKDPKSNHENILLGHDDFALSDEISSQEDHNGLIAPQSFESELHIIEPNPAVGDVTRKYMPHNSWAATNKSPTPSSGSQRRVSISAEAENPSDLTLGGGYESSGSVKPPYPNVICSDWYCEVGDLDKDSLGKSDVPDAWSSETDSKVARKRVIPPIIVSWKEPAVGISEIPSSSKKSDVSDLGDRYSYATLNAPGRRSSIEWPALDDTHESLALQDRFFEALVRPHEEKKGFFPRRLLSTLVTEGCVFNELSKYLRDTHNPNQIKAYAEIICKESSQPRDEDDDRPPKIKSFKKIFAILVLIEKTSSIPKFLDEDLNDLYLPLTKLPKGKNGSRFQLRLSKHPDKILECFGNWTPFYLKAFEEWQWTTVSPFFYKGSCKDVEHWPLQPSVMLPFTVDGRRGKESEYRTEIEGGYSRVFKVDIHPDHHSFDLPKNQCFAIKRLNSQSKEDFKKEVEMLRMFSDDTRYPHLISLLATYEQFGAYFLVFPWADGDLNEFWSVLKPKPSFDLETVKWVVKQCEGIAHGLTKIHHHRTSSLKCHTCSHEHFNEPHEPRYGRHGDLKPENILWFSDSNGGILKISDFGLSEYSTNHSKSYKPKSRVATSMSYRPPECDLKDGKIGPSYDIWTLGCLYLEFITWLLGGWQLVKDFETKRMSFDPMWYDMTTDTFFEIAVQRPNSSRSGTFVAMVKPAVKNFIKQLHALLDMLIVKPNDPNEAGRITSDQVNVKLTAMLKKSEDHEMGSDYLCTPAPWCSRLQDSDNVLQISSTDSEATILNHKRFRQYIKSIHEQSYLNMLTVPSDRGRRRSSYSSYQ